MPLGLAGKNFCVNMLISVAGFFKSKLDTEQDLIHRFDLYHLIYQVINIAFL